MNPRSPRTTNRMLLLFGLVGALATLAAGIDRGIVEDGTNGATANDATDGGVVLVKNNGTTQLEPAICSGSTCTRLAPDGGNEGLSVEEIASYRLMLCAAPGQVLSSAGKEELWVYDPVLGRWGHVASSDLSVTVTDACQSWEVSNNMQGAGVRVLYRPNGVAPLVFDGGAPITSLQACKGGQGLPFRGGGCGP